MKTFYCWVVGKNDSDWLKVNAKSFEDAAVKAVSSDDVPKVWSFGDVWVKEDNTLQKFLVACVQNERDEWVYSVQAVQVDFADLVRKPAPPAFDILLEGIRDDGFAPKSYAEAGRRIMHNGAMSLVSTDEETIARMAQYVKENSEDFGEINNIPKLKSKSSVSARFRVNPALLKLVVDALVDNGGVNVSVQVIAMKESCALQFYGGKWSAAVMGCRGKEDTPDALCLFAQGK